MPYELYKQDGKFCVRNKDTGEGKGCSDTRNKAVAHMRALYAAAAGETLGKSINELDESNWDAVEALVNEEIKSFEEQYGADETEESGEMDDKELSDKSFFGATSYSELEEMQEAREKTARISDLIHEFPYLASNILDNPMIENKEGGIQKLAAELTTRITSEKNKELEEGEIDVEQNIIERAKEYAKDIVQTLFNLGKEEEQKAMMIWKEKNGEYRWFARYSNNRRDRDIPPEIISEKSHRRFVELVDKGQAPLPELWLWHVPEWKIGQADWVGYDDTGFALAYGHFNKGCEPVAERLNSKSMLVSHGMPPNTIRRDSEDDSVIIEHITAEISPLPEWAAANELTGFITLNADYSKEAEMAIPKKKRQSLIDDWGIPEELISHVESLNAETAQMADEKGIESKETNEEKPEATTAEAEVVGETTEAVEEETTTAEETDADKEAATEETPAEEADTEEEENPEVMKEFATRQETVDAISTVILPVMKDNQENIKQLTNVVGILAEKVEGLEKSDTAKVKEQVENSSLATLTALLQQSVIRDDETRVDGREGLAKSKPKEKEAPAEAGLTPVPIINKWLQGDFSESEKPS